MKLTLALATAFVACSFGFSAHSAPLSLDIDPSVSYQQTQNSPCVIGNPSCNNPGGFGSTTLASNPPGDTYTNVGSPIYTVQQIRDLVGNVFLVGIDVNTTTQPLATEILDSFSLAINGVTEFLFTGPTQLKTNNNGNGYSDALISGFDLSNFAGGASAQFFVTYHGATDGREQFFLVAGEDDNEHGVPAPATLSLVALGLLGMAGRRRRLG